MSDTKVTPEHALHATTKHGCCGGTHAEAQTRQPTEPTHDDPLGAATHDHAHQRKNARGCGGGKPSK